MKIFKFGGASLKSADAIINMKRIIDRFENEELLIVVSAMGKTTNALERVFSLAWRQMDYSGELQDLKDFHTSIAGELFKKSGGGKELLEPMFKELEMVLDTCYNSPGYDEKYDTVIPYGELKSSALVHGVLNSRGNLFRLLDARKFIITDERFRDAGINWAETQRKINEAIQNDPGKRRFITQGFIGCSSTGKMTTLGREGSDFTAAIFANCLSASSVTIWKDVPGILNADPKRMPDTILFPDLSYQESAEMSFYGATVIHPRTIKPLADKNIPLYVKSFESPDLPGTLIKEGIFHPPVPAYIFKDNQCLISFTRRDLEFINERNLGEIFYALDDLNIKLNLMQNSAVSFTICINEDHDKLKVLSERLSGHFKIRYNEGLQLITIKNYNQDSIDRVSPGKNILLEQRSRNTYQIVNAPDQT